MEYLLIFCESYVHKKIKVEIKVLLCKDTRIFATSKS